MKLILLLLFIWVTSCKGFLEPGIVEDVVTLSTNNDDELVAFSRTAFAGTKIRIRLDCGDDSNTGSFSAKYYIRSSPCDREFIDILDSERRDAILRTYIDPVSKQTILDQLGYDQFAFFKGRPSSNDCGNAAVLTSGTDTQWISLKTDKKSADDIREHQSLIDQQSKRRAKRAISNSSLDDDSFAAQVPGDSVYLVVVQLTGNGIPKGGNLTVNVRVEWVGYYGYLSAIDWPLLPFYGTMCGVYAVLCLAWLIVSACQWKDLLRIQFWIGAVLIIGMLEKAVFLAEYQNMNRNGYSVMGLIQFAEILSCMKKTLARILIIIVSVGFGVVKPRLGSTLHKIMAVGMLYFLLCSIEGISRVSKLQHQQHHKQQQLIAIPVVLMDAGICYWIFTSLWGTMRALRVRRNEPKLFLYRHFTNTLMLAVLASVAVMLWSIFTHKFTRCLQDWMELWIDVAAWHILFSVILLVVMILWRPTNNNQRYAFTPLLESLMDDDEDTVMSETIELPDDMQLRNLKGVTTSQSHHDRKPDTSLEDDLRWVEEHLPAALADTALPALMDSDDERKQVLTEVSKLQ